MTRSRHATIAEICRLAPVVPVLVIDDLEKAVPLAEALVAGGLKTLEITLRTPVALDAVTAMRKACPDAIVGVGTLRSAEDVARSIEAGAQFGVSPGSPATVLNAVEAHNLPFLPGVSTATEAMTASERGYSILKLFPAEAVGGRALLSSLASPLAGVSFCPTGGISLATAPDYLALSNVICVGGSWVAPKQAIKNNDWAEIEKLAREAASL